MIQYSAAAQRGRAHLLQKYNDVLLFVEDETCQNMHVRFFAKILEGIGKLQHVFPLHGRAAVLNAALSDTSGDPRVIYVIDGDLDVLTGRPVPTCQNLYRVNAYCIENLIISEQGLLTVAAESSVEQDARSLRHDLAFSPSKRSLERLLIPLFREYAIVSRLGLGMETVKFAVVRLCKDDAPYVDARSLRSRIREIRKQVIASVGWATYRAEKDLVSRQAKALRDKSMAISGKDYLLPLVQRWLRAKFGFRDSRSGLAVRLASHASPDVEPGLRDFVRSAALAGYQLHG
jgi:hypothetical protein